VCCLGMASAFCIVVDEEGWWWWKLLFGAEAHNTSSAAKPRPPPLVATLLQVARQQEGATTPQRVFGMVGARSSFSPLPKATLTAPMQRMQGWSEAPKANHSLRRRRRLRQSYSYRLPPPKLPPTVAGHWGFVAALQHRSLQTPAASTTKQYRLSICKTS